MKIICIIGESQYDSTARFMGEMVERMRECGWQVDVLDGRVHQGYEARRQEILQNRYDMIFTINGMLLEEDSALGHQLLKDNIIYCTYLMDHPLVHRTRLQNTYPRIFVLSPDRNHVAYTDRYLTNIWGTAFLPHGGCRGRNCKEYRERKIDLSLMGSYTPSAQIWKEMQAYPPEMVSLWEEAAALLCRQPDQTVEQAVLQCFAHRGIEVPEKDLPGVVSEFRIVDRYVRSYFREAVVRTLIEAGIRVDVYGDGWEQMETDARGYLQIHPRVSYEESLELIGDSKISLNVMPWFKDGSHDRVFTAMLNGAVCLTDGSGYLQEEFQEQENLFFYSLKGLKYLPDKVRQILGQETQSSRVAANGMRLAQQKHTWAHRAEEVMDYLEQIAGMCEEEPHHPQQKNDSTCPQVFQKNKALVGRINNIIRCLRQQDYLYGLREVTLFTREFSEMLPLYHQCQDTFHGMGIVLEEETLLGILQDIVNAQQRKDYIRVADLLEEQLLSRILSIQEGYIRSGFVETTVWDRYRIEPAASGEYTLAVQGQEGWCCLHSGQNPREEGRMLAESWFDGEHYDYIVYGLGLGYHIQALLEIGETVSVTVLEADQNILTLAEEYGVAGSWKEDDRVTLLWDPDFQKLVGIAGTMQEGSRFVVHYPSLQLIRQETYRRQLEHYFMEYSSAQISKVSMRGNFLKNKCFFGQEVSDLGDVFRGQTVYIIAAGPSLDKNITELQKVGNRGIILATGTVLKKLLATGITPDYVIITDSGEGTFRQVENINHTEVPLLFLATVYYKIPLMYPGSRYVIFQQGFPQSEICAGERHCPVYETGGSVTTTALEISIRLGADRIVLVGADLAYTGNKSHVSGTVCEREIASDKDCMVTDIYGQQVPSAQNLISYREWIERRIARESDSGITFIDATEGGARIRGTRIERLCDVVG